MGSVRHRILALVVVLGMLMPLTACGAPEPTTAPVSVEAPAIEEPASEELAAEASDDKVLKIGALIPLSGYTARTGEEMKAAVEMAMEEIDYKIGSYTVEMVWIDCQGDPGKAAQAYEQAIVQQGIDAAILNWDSSVAVACMELSAKHKVPHFFGFGATEVIKSTRQTRRNTATGWAKPGPARPS